MPNCRTPRREEPVVTDCRAACPIAEGGYCERHGVNKTKEWVQLCRRKPKYWRAWEVGRGIGQMASQELIPHNSHIGDLIERRLEAWGMHPVPGCQCPLLKWAMNVAPADEVLSELSKWVSALKKSAKRWKEVKGGAWRLVPAPPRWLCRKVIREAAEESLRLYPPQSPENGS